MATHYDNGRYPLGTKGKAYLRIHNNQPKEVELMAPLFLDAALAQIETEFKFKLFTTAMYRRSYGARPRVEMVQVSVDPPVWMPKYYSPYLLPFCVEVVGFRRLA